MSETAFLQVTRCQMGAHPIKSGKVIHDANQIDENHNATLINDDHLQNLKSEIDKTISDNFSYSDR